MEVVKIYLAGAMAGLSFEEMSKWRNQIMNAIKFGDYEYNKSVDFFNPTAFYNFDEKNYKSEREVRDFDLYNLRKSDLIIVNLDKQNSIGTAQELAIAYEMKIPVIAFGVKEELHPWIECCCSRICNNMRELVEYVCEYYLN